MSEEKLFVRAKQAAAMLDIGVSTLWRDVKEKRLPEPVKIGGCTRWRVADIRAVLVKQAEAVPDPAEDEIIDQPIDGCGFHLYRHFDKDGALLYVGVSLSTVIRLAQHKGRSEWFKQIARVEITNWATREASLRAERRAIRLEKPLYNITHALRMAA